MSASKLAAYVGIERGLAVAGHPLAGAGLRTHERERARGLPWWRARLCSRRPPACRRFFDDRLLLRGRCRGLDAEIDQGRECLAPFRFLKRRMQRCGCRGREAGGFELLG